MARAHAGVCFKHTVGEAGTPGVAIAPPEPRTRTGTPTPQWMQVVQRNTPTALAYVYNGTAATPARACIHMCTPPDMHQPRAPNTDMHRHVPHPFARRGPDYRRSRTAAPRQRAAADMCAHALQSRGGRSRRPEGEGAAETRRAARCSGSNFEASERRQAGLGPIKTAGPASADMRKRLPSVYVCVPASYDSYEWPCSERIHKPAHLHFG